jgi:hypothetical protein
MVTDKNLLPWAETPINPYAILSYSNAPSVNDSPDSVSIDVSINQGDVAVRKVLENVMTLWVDALVNADFTVFHQNLSSSWREKDNPVSLKEAFSILAPYKESLTLFPTRGKLVLLESRPFTDSPLEGEIFIRDNIGPESPWLVRGEWRVNKTALGFTLVLSFEGERWLPSGLRVEIFT